MGAATVGGGAEQSVAYPRTCTASTAARPQWVQHLIHLIHLIDLIELD
ncbi:hypothetical protein [Streptomyces sp. NPDC048111]